MNTETKKEPPSLKKIALILIGLILVLSVCVFLIIYVIPTTNIFTLEDNMEQYLFDR